MEINDPQSKFNGFELKVDDSFSRLSAIIPIPEEFQIAGTDMDIMNKLKEIVKPITNYICFELGWAEYILVPEFFYLDDPQSPGTSRTYLVVWQYKSIVLDTVFGTALLFPCLPFHVLIVGKYSVKLATGTLSHILLVT